jgi:hypothetical protein
MAAVFGPGASLVAKLALAVAGLGFLLVHFGPRIFPRLDDATGVQGVRSQPAPFRHKHHVGSGGIDCRTCHTTVETAAGAGYPSAHICMSCHAQSRTNARMLESVRLSLAENKPLHWHRLNRLPDYVFFDHSIHVTKGVGCTTCHGPIDRMALVWRGASLSMSWCLDCHRDPAPELRPLDQVFNPHWRRTARTPSGEALMAKYKIDPKRLTDCSVCHR